MLAPYQARPYTPDSRRMADLALREGDIAAQGHLARGAAWSGMLSDLANITGRSLMGVAAYKEDAPRREAEQLAVQEGRRRASERANVRGLAQMAGAAKMSPEQEADLFQQEGFREHADSIRANALKLTAARRELALSTLQILDGLSRGMAASQYSPNAFLQSTDALVKMGALEPKDVAPYEDRVKAALAQDPTLATEEVQRIVTEIRGQMAPFLGKKDAGVVVPRGALYIDPITGETRVDNSIPTAPAKTPTGEAAYLDALARGDDKGAGAILQAHGRWTAAGRKPEGAGGEGGGEKPPSRSEKNTADNQYQAELDQIRDRYNKGLEALLFDKDRNAVDPKALTGPEGAKWTRAHEQLLTSMRADQRRATDTYRRKIGLPPVTDAEWQRMVSQTRQPKMSDLVGQPAEVGIAPAPAGATDRALTQAQQPTPSAGGLTPMDLEAARLLSEIRNAPNPNSPDIAAKKMRLRELYAQLQQ